jgi:hypothetical protein
MLVLASLGSWLPFAIVALVCIENLSFVLFNALFRLLHFFQ